MYKEQYNIKWKIGHSIKRGSDFLKKGYVRLHLPVMTFIISGI